MSDYNSLRLKKNVELQNAMANVRKDLYEWKSSSVNRNLFKLNSKSIMSMQPAPPVRLKSLDSPGRPCSSKLSESLLDLNQQKVLTNSNDNQKNSRKLVDKQAANNDLDLFKSDSLLTQPSSAEFLTNFNEDRVYLLSARTNPRMISKKSPKEIEDEFVINMILIFKNKNFIIKIFLN